MRTLAIGLAFLVACDGKKPAAPPLGTVPRAQRPAQRPPPPPALPTSAAIWSAAEASHSAEAWDAAAESYTYELAACTSSCSETAYAIVLARENALAAAPIDPPPAEDLTPVALPPRVQGMVDAIDGYVAKADPSDPDLPGMKFLAGAALTKWHQPDALERLAEVLRDYRDADVAEYSANILLDALLRADRGSEARALIDELLADTAFLAGKDDLRETLTKLDAMLPRG